MKKFLRQSKTERVDGSGTYFIAPFSITQEKDFITGSPTELGWTTAGIDFFLTDPAKAIIQIRALVESTGTHELRMKYFDVPSQTWKQVGQAYTIPDTSSVGKDNIVAVFMDPNMPLTPVTWIVEGTKGGAGTCKVWGISGALFGLP